MKTRQGFVSNSSSSSFIVKVGEVFDNVFDVAEYMIPKREWDNDKELLAKLQELKTTNPSLEGICFRSCNCPTYIAKVDDHILVETCNNHDWDMWDFDSVKQVDDFYSSYGDADEHSLYKLPRNRDFYHLEFDKVGREVDYDRNVPIWCDTLECRGDVWVINNQYECVECGKIFKPKK